MKIWNFGLFVTVAMMGSSGVSYAFQGDDGGEHWLPQSETDGEVPGNAVRVGISKGLPLCKGTWGEENEKLPWPDIGVVHLKGPNKGQCETKRKGNNRFQDDYYF